MDKSVHITVPSDDEGYVSFQCGKCGDRFKLQATEYQEADVELLYCPLCGLNGEPGEFLTQEVTEIAMRHATEMAKDAIHDIFKDRERKTRGNKSVRWEAGHRGPRDPIPELREVTDLAIVAFSCCSRTAKVPHSDALSGTYCPYCGTEQV